MRSAEPGPAWLSKAAELQVCPLCVAANEIENEYLRGFCQGLAEPGHDVARFVCAPGFCLDHATKFEQAVLRGDGVLAAAVDLYVKVLESVVDKLAELEQDGWLETAECPLCVSRDRQMVTAAHLLVAALDQVPGAAEASLRAGGLCIGHFVLTWVVSEETANRDLLQAIQCEATVDLIRHLRALAPDELGGDPAGQRETLTTWGRATRAVSGWTVTRR